MKILWVKSDFLHPATRGGQIRTLEMLRRLHRRHEIHYVALDAGQSPEGVARSGEYCSQVYPIRHFVPEKTSPAFAGQLLAGLFSPLPVAVSRYRSRAMRRQIATLLQGHRFDSLVCDFLFPAPNIPDLAHAVLFQHNVETVIWRRRVEQAPDPLRRAYLALQARRMEAFESRVCRGVGHIVAVSETDAAVMRNGFGADRVSEISTGVDLEYFAPPASAPAVADLVFVGSMDWDPNIDGIEFFVRQVLPRIRERRPRTTLAVVGRKPAPRVLNLAGAVPGLIVTGTVPDIRPYLWGSLLSIVPLRIGGGTRLKIYEAMAARVPVVSTAVGFEGLPLTPGEHLAAADTPEQFAACCLELLENESDRRRIAAAGHELVASRCSWEAVVAQFEQILKSGPRPE